MFSFSGFMKSLSHIRGVLLLALLLFVAGGIIGWIGTGSIERLIHQQVEGLGQISGNLRDTEHPKLSFFIFIFLNNSVKGVLIIFAGALFGILPAIFLLINGAVIGYLIHYSALQGDDLFALIVKGLLPHGIIEIPAILIACAFGLKFGGRVARFLFRPGSEELKRNSWKSFFRLTATASFWIVLLLLLAALIESTITFSLLS
ncbi:stage II sporulation protein M [Paenibacillus sp. NFR01]|uniref:stage II sporulation protein M n=1 Tax=Paenibacillus sp. NFR01 TaxID=1566279 RepID=UPI0008D7F312|nr:stage II sporulation protein M [Paenibacillus sp. NFR01]SEU31040.1 stage II sporulation protein M [Paenibacillus sp. NFR01]